eukprot:6178877-Pleurochrysis_carterae.AAC.7
MPLFPWPSRARAINDGIEREAQKLLTGLFWPRRKPARCWRDISWRWCRICDASQRCEIGAARSSLSCSRASGTVERV